MISAIHEATENVILPLKELIFNVDEYEPVKSEGGPRESAAYTLTPFIYVFILLFMVGSIEINSNNCHVFSTVS